MIGRSVVPWACALFLACSPVPSSTPPVSSPPSRPPPPAATGEAAALLPESASRISFERIAKFPEPGWNVPRQMRFSSDGKQLTYLMSEAGTDEMALMSLDLETRTTRVLVRAADLAQSSQAPTRAGELRDERQRKRIKGITDFVWAKEAQVLVISAGASVFVRGADGSITPITPAGVETIDAKPSPDGARVAYVKNGELEVLEVATKATTALTTRAPKGTTRGLSDFNGQEEFDEASGFFWSPDSKRIVYLEVDETAVQEIPVLGHRAGAPDLMLQKYPEAGRKNPIVKLFVVELATKKSTRIPLPSGVAEGGYLGRFRFTPDSRELVYQAVSRSQRQRQLIASELGPAPKSRILETRTPKVGWVELSDMLIARDGKAVYFTAEQSGHLHLASLPLSGSVSQATFLTRGAWDVSALVGLDDTSGAVVISATEGDPIGRAVLAVDPARPDAKPTPLSDQPGVSTATLGKQGAIAIAHSARDVPPHAWLSAGGKRTELAIAKDPDIEALGVRPVQNLELVGPSGDTLYGALLAPRQLDPTKRYPLVQMVYGGPGVQTVQNRWAPRLAWQHLADRGFFVMQIDNRGSAGRGPAFEAPIDGRLGEVELQDQLAALDHALAHYPIDPKRVAIYGHSYGGFMAAYAMLKAPKRYKSAIAASPVTDWKLYDTGYTERYLGTPDGNAAGYDASDLEKLAKNLEGQLLIVHALMDENVHFQHTADLIDALVREKKDFRMFVFPGERHGYRSPSAKLYAAQLSTRFLAETLAP